MLRPKHRIRELREDLGFTRKAFAAKIGTSTKHLYMIERGAVNPSVPLLLAIADELGGDLNAVYPREQRLAAAAA